MKVCRDKRTNEYINDFQARAEDGTLIRNAVRAGLGQEADFEEIEVSNLEYEQIKEEVIAPKRAAAEAQEIQKQQQREQLIRSIQTKLGLTDEQMNLLKEG